MGPIPHGVECGRVDGGEVEPEEVGWVQSATAAEEMVSEWRKLAQLHRNVVVKVPITREGLKAVKIFSSEGIRTNVPDLAKHLADDVTPFDPSRPDPSEGWAVPASPATPTTKPAGG